MTFVFPYGTLQNPNCIGPEADIIVSNPSDDSKKIEIRAIVDSGATNTCIPEKKVADLGWLNYKTAKIRDANGNIITRRIYTVNIQLPDHPFNDIEVVALPKDYAIIGRDILNRSKIMLHAEELQGVYDCTVNCPLIEDE